MSNLSVYFGFVGEVGELFARGKHAGLSQAKARYRESIDGEGDRYSAVNLVPHQGRNTAGCARHG